MWQTLDLHDRSMTVKNAVFGHLHAENSLSSLQQLKTIAFTHRNTPIRELNRFFLHEENRKERLAFLKFNLELGEILYIATCNRIEFIFTSNFNCDEKFLQRFFRAFRSDWDEQEIEFAIKHGDVFEGEDALRHIYRVASSLESLVIGEREIITQVRKAYDTCREEGLTGDFLRLLIKSTITTAKQVYTHTKIAANPVSVVSLAERRFRELLPDSSVKILLIGAGETNSNIVKYLIKHGYSHFTIFNRTLEHAENLARQLNSAKVYAKALPLSALTDFREGFDAVFSCTSSPEAILTTDVYRNLLNGDTNTKVLVDLAVPQDIDPAVRAEFPVALISIVELKTIADKNLQERKSEFAEAEAIIEDCILEFRQLRRTRTLELKMKEVPEKIREIKDKALKDIFARDIESLDERSREVLVKVMDYMEKKCISVPMVMAKEIILETSN